MMFCGQCGLQLSPNDIRCPRCGALADSDLAVEAPHPDDPTIAIQPYGTDARIAAPPYQQSPLTPVNPQPLILGSGSNHDERTGSVYQHGSWVNAPAFPTGQGRSNPNMSSPYQGYSSRQAQYAPIQGVGNSTYSGVRSSEGVGYTGYPITFEQSQARSRAAQNAHGRMVALVLIFLGLLLILGAMALFAAHNGLLTSLIGTNRQSATTISSTAQAQAVVQQYYDAVNSKHYREAYTLLQNTPQKVSFQAFKEGYKYTKHDDVTFTSITPQNDGTVKVGVTIIATEQLAQQGTRRSTYTGYYVVGQHDGVWKILNGQLSHV